MFLFKEFFLLFKSGKVPTVRLLDGSGARRAAAGV